MNRWKLYKTKSIKCNYKELKNNVKKMYF